MFWLSQGFDRRPIAKDAHATAAGFSYNIGRIVAAAGTVIFGLLSHVGDFRVTLLCDSLLMVPAMICALRRPDLRD